MKKLFNALLVVAITAAISSCGNTNPPDYVPDAQLAIIKLTPELQEQVFVSPVVDSVYRNTDDNSFTLYNGDGLVLCNPNRTDSILADYVQSQFAILGTSPYIMLENGYAIIDWRWAHFQPLSGEWRNTRNSYANPLTNMVSGYSTHFPSSHTLLKNEEYYLLSMRWDELKDMNKIWEMSEGKLIKKPEILYVNTKDIENYGNLTISAKDLPFLDLYSIYNLYGKDEVSYRKCVENMDMLQASYVDVLNQMIKNKDIDTWKQF